MSGYESNTKTGMGDERPKKQEGKEKKLDEQMNGMENEKGDKGQKCFAFF